MKKNKKTFSDERILSILHKPLLTEKSTNLNQFNQYSFVVSKDSNVYEIKNAIEKVFKVKVIKVNTSILRGKVKSFKGSIGYNSDFDEYFGKERPENRPIDSHKIKHKRY